MASRIEHAWLPDLIYAGGRFHRDVALVCDNTGGIVRIAPADEVKTPTRLKNRALLPGLVNTHSHVFQRVIRGRTEHRTEEGLDSFWTWREMMYSAATRLTPQDVYDAARMAFLEMVLGGITAVGEFHYLHHAPDGTPYDDPNLIAKETVRAAVDTGLRIALLRVAYARSGYNTESNPRQARFLETDAEDFLRHVEKLSSNLAHSVGRAWVGVAPHSVRAVPLAYLKEVVRYAHEEQLPVHMHVAEQPAEVSVCIQEYGRSPVALLETEGLLSDRFTAVHAIHVTPKSIHALAEARATICACPTTERNLGDGVVPVDLFFKDDVRVALGTDSHVEIDLLEDARELEYHLRLQKLQRAVLAPDRSPTRGPRTGSRPGVGAVRDGALAEDRASALAARLFDCATSNGAESIGAPGGSLEPGHAADFFTVDLNDPSIAGANQDDLLTNIVFSLSRTAVRDVVVGGKQIVSDGKHADQDEIVQRFSALQKKLWN
jgi:formimidoylglutamate deiminase